MCTHICACNPVCGMVAGGQGQIQDCAACVSIQDKVKSVAMPQCAVVYVCVLALSRHLLISAVDNCPSGLQVDHVRHCYAIYLWRCSAK